jgi:hypothetical protein
VNRYALLCIVVVIITILISGLDITYMHQANYIVSGLELPSSGTGGTTSSVTNDLLGASITPTSSNLTQTGNVTKNTTLNDTNLNSNITNKSSSLNSNITNKSSLNTTMPEQLPPQSLNGSTVRKI